jgi:hypothetical protein
MAAMLDFASLPQDFALRVVCIRHGEPDPAAKGRCYGRLDLGLSEAGRAQIQSKVEAVRNLKADALYSSPRRRARESSEIIRALTGLEPIFKAELQEIDFGSFEGLTYQLRRNEGASTSIQEIPKHGSFRKNGDCGFPRRGKSNSAGGCTLYSRPHNLPHRAELCSNQCDRLPAGIADCAFGEWVSSDVCFEVVWGYPP